MKNPLTPSGIEPTTFRFVAQNLKLGNVDEGKAGSCVPIYDMERCKNAFRPHSVFMCSVYLTVVFPCIASTITIDNQQDTTTRILIYLL